MTVTDPVINAQNAIAVSAGGGQAYGPCEALRERDTRVRRRVAQTTTTRAATKMTVRS